jgi:hypothetical protein
MKARVYFCDATERKLPTEEDGAVFLKDNGDGAWEIHSHVCQEYIQNNGIKVLSKEKCRMIIESKGGFLNA